MHKSLAFDRVDIQWDPRVREPQPWTTKQSHMAAAVAHQCPPGPVLELSDGVGAVGLLTAALTDRDLVQVVPDALSAEYARRNAAAAEVTSDVRVAADGDELNESETFALVVVDPPRAARDRDEVPVDPVHSAPDSHRWVRPGLDTALHRLMPEGWCVLQLGSREEARTAGQVIEESAADTGVERTVGQVCEYAPGCILMSFGPAASRGAISEAYRDAGEPVYPTDATAGYPDEDADVQEGTAGPNARPIDNSPNLDPDELSK